ncbi:MAG TPA: hypothetical protein VGS15_10170 [Candidatus Acidoferrales bacterium]|nr:hypothetical protein [Candidatus Acidoferrales bacterium]
MAVLDDGDPGRLNPLAIVGDMGVDAHGAEDGIGGDSGIVHALQDAFSDAAKPETTLKGQAGGVGVAIDAGTAGKLKIVDDVMGIFPVEEFAFDFLALGMIADGAFAGVALKVGGQLGGGTRGSGMR